MNLLCWDTCTETVSVTLVQERRFFFEKKRLRSFAGGPASFLIPLIHEVCEKANTKLTEIDLLGVTQGPGSLTGIRIGLSAAYGLSYALQKPLRGETLFELWKDAARALRPGRALCVLVDTYGTYFATQFYDSQGLPLGTPALHTFDTLQEEIEKNFCTTDVPILVGQGFKKLSILDNFLKILDFLPIEENISYLLAKKIMNTNNYFSSEPLYMTPCYIHLPPVKVQETSEGTSF